MARLLRAPANVGPENAQLNKFSVQELKLVRNLPHGSQKKKNVAQSVGGVHQVGAMSLKSYSLLTGKKRPTIDEFLFPTQVIRGCGREGWRKHTI